MSGPGRFRRRDVESESSMTEAEWQRTDNPFRMLTYLRDDLNATLSRRGRRKLRLYGCACCRHVWARLTDERSRAAVEAGEEFADNLVSPAELKSAKDHAVR